MFDLLEIVSLENFGSFFCWAYEIGCLNLIDVGEDCLSQFVCLVDHFQFFGYRLIVHFEIIGVCFLSILLGSFLGIGLFVWIRLVSLAFEVLIWFGACRGV